MTDERAQFALELEELDRDGALREAEERLARTSRRGLLGAAAAGGTALVALARPAAARALTKNDVAILVYVLTLEELQASFYTESGRLGALRGKAADAARRVGVAERAHVAAIRKELGRAAIRRPRFNFGDLTQDQRTFLRTAVALEDLSVAAYKAQAPRIDSRDVLALVLSIHSVEARHAAWLRHLFGITPTGEPFDPAIEKPEIMRVIRSTRFIAGQERGTRAPGRRRRAAR